MWNTCRCDSYLNYFVFQVHGNIILEIGKLVRDFSAEAQRSGGLALRATTEAGEARELFSLWEYEIMRMSHYEIMKLVAKESHNPIIS